MGAASKRGCIGSPGMPAPTIFAAGRCRNRSRGEALEQPERSAGPAQRLEHVRDAARLKRALMALRDDKRELIVLARYRALKHEQIAELLGIETGAVKVRLHRALRELRDIFFKLSDESSSCSVKTSTRAVQII